jgi:hypothetical protein
MLMALTSAFVKSDSRHWIPVGATTVSVCGALTMVAEFVRENLADY